MSDETFLSTVLTLPKLPDVKAKIKKSWFEMVNVNVSHLKERWRFVTEFRLWFLNTRLQLPLRSSISMAWCCTHSLVRARAPQRDLLLFLIFTLNSKLIYGTRACSQQPLLKAMMGLNNEQTPQSEAVGSWESQPWRTVLRPKTSAVRAVLYGADRQSDSECASKVAKHLDTEVAVSWIEKKTLQRILALVKPGRPLEEAVAWGALVKNTLRSQGLYISTHNCATTVL